jgi:hypothetical protein
MHFYEVPVHDVIIIQKPPNVQSSAWRDRGSVLLTHRCQGGCLTGLHVRAFQGCTCVRFNTPWARLPGVF